MQHIIQLLATWLNLSKYSILLLGTFFEGPIVMLSSGFLFKLGIFSFWPMYLALVVGDFFADIGWYCIGRFGGRPLVSRIGPYFGISEHSIDKVQGRFYKYHERILIFSKLTMGFGLALVTLTVAGMLKVPFRNYVIINLLGGFVWTGFLLLIGYFFGNLFVLIPGWGKYVFVGVLVIVLIITVKIVKKYLIDPEL